MDKMKFETADGAVRNVDKIAAVFPHVVTEIKGEDGKITRAVKWEVLKELLSGEYVEGGECYDFTWPGKRAAIADAAKPIRKTLRPCKEESKDWDTTQNLYIEGDNLEVLKLLQESYLGKVKMIYIDPPYNTGNDFVYRDDFKVGSDQWTVDSGEVAEDEETGEKTRMFKNTEANGRFHSFWCSMIYMRLVIAYDILCDGGVIFVSIDDHELYNLKKILDEIFGTGNFLGMIVVKSNPRGSMSTAEIANLHEYLLVYSKDKQIQNIVGHKLTENMDAEYKYTDKLGRYRLLGLRMRGGFWRRSDRPKLYYPIYVNPSTGEVSLTKNNDYNEEVLPIQPTTGEDGTWRWSTEKISAEKDLLIGKMVFRDSQARWDIFQKDYLNRESERRTKAKSIWEDANLNYQNGTLEIKNLFGKSGIFDYSKPVFLLKKCLEMIDLKPDDIILDFFSGSATTAHAVMQLNAEDGGKRKFIMVQWPEECPLDSEAAKSGYANICEIGKERIRRAGEKIKEEAGLAAANLDVGFRVFKVADSNMKDVYYSADEYSQDELDGLVSNIKEDRTDLDLLYGCLLEWGVELSLPHTSETIDGVTVHTVNSGDLIACFDQNIPESAIRKIAKRHPLRAVFRDSSFASAPQKINVEEIFKLLSPATTVKVI